MRALRCGTELHLIIARVGSLKPHKLFMGALLDHAPALDDSDPRGGADRRETMGDDEGRAPPRKLLERALDLPSLSLSSALVASSSMRMRGSRKNTRAIATRCFCPPESRAPRSPTTVS